MSTHRYYRREFINRPGHHSTAFIYAVVDRTRATDEYNGEISLELADCCRRVNFSIDIDCKESRENSLHKLDALIESLTGFRKAFKEECAVQERREIKRKDIKPIKSG